MLMKRGFSILLVFIVVIYTYKVIYAQSDSLKSDRAEENVSATSVRFAERLTGGFAGGFILVFAGIEVASVYTGDDSPLFFLKPAGIIGSRIGYTIGAALGTSLVAKLYNIRGNLWWSLAGSSAGMLIRSSLIYVSEGTNA